jgi:hypothetical protein
MCVDVVHLAGEMLPVQRVPRVPNGQLEGDRLVRNPGTMAAYSTVFIYCKRAFFRQ